MTKDADCPLCKKHGPPTQSFYDLYLEDENGKKYIWRVSRVFFKTLPRQNLENVPISLGGQNENSK